MNRNKREKKYPHRHLRDERGFTLLEMVLVMALIGIFFTMVAFLVPVWYETYQNSMKLNYARQIADSVLGAVKNRFVSQTT
jgi:prepilin-type N-terminal cleavage/methylation domain-containing protein